MMETQAKPLSFGLYLQTLRREKGISLETVARETRIGIQTLRLLEQEDHENLPAEVFVKGFLRAYAAAIGADGSEVVQRYNARVNVYRNTQKLASAPPRFKTRFWTRFLLAICLFALLVSGSVYALNRYVLGHVRPASLTGPVAADEQRAVQAGPEARPAAARPRTGAEPAVAPQAGAAIEPAKTTEPAPGQNASGTAATEAAVAAAGKNWRLQIHATEDTWIKIIADNRKASEYSLKSGDRLEVEADTDFNLLIGNAGGIEMTLNGKTVAIDGKSGDVINLQLP